MGSDQDTSERTRATSRRPDATSSASARKTARAAHSLSLSVGEERPEVRAVPTFLSPFPEGTDLSRYRAGLALLGETETVQGRNVAGVLEAATEDGEPLYPTVGVLMPRRSTKTTSIWAVLLGRCLKVPGYRVAATAQDGTRASQRIREVMRGMEAQGFEESGLGVLEWSNGREAIRFANGSRLWTVKPVAVAFRSEAADALLFDEAGELSADQSEDLSAGALPLLDTRPMGQAIVAGTPSKSRDGLLWDTLEDGRALVRGEVRARDDDDDDDDERDDEEPTGVVEYSLRDDEELVLVDDDGEVIGLDENVLRRVHPGLDVIPDSGHPLTTMRKMRARFKKLGRTRFEMEYGCRFPWGQQSDALDPVRWEAARVDPLERPERLGIAFDCAYDGTSASIAYAWRLDDGTAVIELVAARLGTGWVANAAHAAAEKHKRVPVAHDDIGANRDPAAALAKRKPAPRIDRLNTKDIVGAASRLANELHAGHLLHFGQLDLDAAVGNLTWRDIGKSGRAFDRKVQAGAPINPVIAASLALWSFDKQPKRTRVQIVA